MRLLRKAHGCASDPVPVLPRGRSAGAIDSPFGARRPPADTPRSAIHAAWGRDLLLRRRIQCAAVGSRASYACGDQLPVASGYSRGPRPDSLRILLAHQILDNLSPSIAPLFVS